MPELLRSIVTRLRAYVADRRDSPRYRLRLPCSVSSYTPGRSGEQAKAAPKLDGMTRDLSASGLSLILPAVRVGERYLTNPDMLLRIVLEHPSGPLEILGTPVHYDQLDAEGPDNGFVIGVRIKEMSADARARYEAHLKKLA